ncbi:MAG: PAS domain S-box protein [Vicinamibacterales bacterium]
MLESLRQDGSRRPAPSGGRPGPSDLPAGAPAGWSAVPWEQTPLGPPAAWPPPLATAAAACLATPAPSLLVWGVERACLFNGAFEQLCATPSASLGADVAACPGLPFSALAPALQEVWSGGRVRTDALRVLRERDGREEEGYLRFACAPMFDGGGLVAGALLTVTDETGHVQAERRLGLLRTLYQQTSRARSVEQACAGIGRALRGAPDLAFALLYVCDGRQATLAARAGVPEGHADAPEQVDLGALRSVPWPIAEALRSREPQRVDRPAAAGPSFVLPLGIPGLNRLLGALVVGLARGVHDDDACRTFLATLGEAVAGALSQAREHAEERRGRAAGGRLPMTERVQRRDPAAPKRLTDAFARVQRHLTLTLNLARTVAWTADAFGDKRWAADSLADIYGVASLPSAEDEWALIHPDDRVRHARTVERGSYGDGYRSTYRIIRPDTGRITWLDERAVATRNAAGVVVELVGVVTDVTEREEVEEQLRVTSERFEAAIDRTPVVVFNQDRDLRYTWIHNPGLGLTPDGVLGLTDADVLEQLEDARRAEAVKRRVLATGHAERGELCVHYKGEPRFFDLLVRPQRGADGSVVGVLGTAVDITERKRVEEHVRFQADVLAQVRDAVVAIDADYRLTYVNEAALRRYGVSEAEVLGRPLHEACEVRWLKPGDEADALESLRTTGQWRGEHVHVTRDGRVIHVESFVSALTGDRTGLLAVIRDITARRRADQWLATEHAVSRLLAEGPGSADVVPALLETLATHLGATAATLWQPDAAGLLLRCAGFAVATPGHDDLRVMQPLTAGISYARGQGLVGRVWETGQPAWRDDVSSMSGLAAALASRAGCQAVLAFPVRHEGRCVAVIELSSPGPAEPEPGYLNALAAIGHEVGLFLRRRAAEEALRRSEALFRAVYENAGAGIALLDPVTSHFVRVNRRLADMLGFDTEELLGRHVQTVTHPDDWALDAEILRASALDANYADLVERRNIRRDGGVVWVQMAVTTLRDHDGRPQATLAMVHDITERKRTEAALKEADRRKDEFLATLAHELRNPLAPIRSAVALLQHVGARDDALQRYRDVIERQVRQMGRLLDDLLDVSRITRGKLVLRTRPVALADALHAAVEASRPLIDASRHDLTLVLPEGAVVVNGDLARLTQVFTNLLNNAAKYSEPGGRIDVRVDIEADDRWGRCAVVSVRDSGVGILPEMLEKVFEPFTQLQTPRTGAPGGLGIGLALARRLVEMHGGTIEARSDGPDAGCTMVIRLPAMRSTAGYLPERSATGEAQAGLLKRVLVVDDAVDSANMLAALVGQLGHEVQVAYGGEEALALVAVFAPDVILLDLGMPGLSGFDVARRVRAHPAGRHVTLIAQTGWGQEQDRQRTADAGFDYHLVKPIDPAVLAQLVGVASTSAPE